MLKFLKSFEDIPYLRSFSKEEAQRIYDKMGLKEKGIDFNEFAEGLNVELEHKDVTHSNPETTAKIALAHLKELPDYYTRLKKMEKGHN